jgi:signal transduction histidine kinase
MIALLERKQQLYLVIGLTAVVAAFGALLAIHLPGDVPVNYPALYALVALTVGSGVVLLLANRWLAARPHLFWLIAGGLYPCLEAVSVYFTGGVRSPFFVLFYFSLFFLSVVGGHRGAALGSLTVGALYVAACVIYQGGINLSTTAMRFTVTLASFYGIAFFAAVLGNIAGQEARDASRRAMRLVGLNAVNATLNESLDLEELVERIPRELCHQLGFQRALVYMLEGDVLKLRAGYANGEPHRLARLMEHLRDHPRCLDSHTVEAEAARTLRPVVCAHPERDPRVHPAVLELAETRAFAAAPMLAKDTLLGVVVADYCRREHAITEEELILLDTFARTAGVAIRNSQLHEEAGRAEVFRQLDALKTEFLASVSHELRTPLTLVRTSADLLLDDVSDGFNPTQQKLVRTISRNAGRLTAFVEEILEMAQLEEGRVELDLQPTDLRLLVDDVARTLELLLQERGQTLYLDLPEEPAVAEVDRHRVQQVVTNLVTNACKYTPEGGKVWVRVLTGQDAVCVEVADNGPGIPPEKLDEVFEKFYRLPDSAQRAKGAGLGLAITRSLVQLHGGTVGVRSEPGGGSTFWFRLQRTGEGDGDGREAMATSAT